MLKPLRSWAAVGGLGAGLAGLRGLVGSSSEGCLAAGGGATGGRKALLPSALLISCIKVLNCLGLEGKCTC